MPDTLDLKKLFGNDRGDALYQRDHQAFAQKVIDEIARLNGTKSISVKYCGEERDYIHVMSFMNDKNKTIDYDGEALRFSKDQFIGGLAHEYGHYVQSVDGFQVGRLDEGNLAWLGLIPIGGWAASKAKGIIAPIIFFGALGFAIVKSGCFSGCKEPSKKEQLENAYMRELDADEFSARVAGKARMKNLLQTLAAQDSSDSGVDNEHPGYSQRIANINAKFSH